MTPSPGWVQIDEFLDTSGTKLPIQDSERYVSYKLEDLWPKWQADARCLGVGNDYYFGEETSQPTMNIKQIRNASKLCEVCPVYDQCLRHALENREEYGVWAGTSGRVRRRIFTLIDQGETDVDEVVAKYLEGNGDYYRRRAGELARARADHSAREAAACLRDEAVGDEPQGDRQQALL